MRIIKTAKEREIIKEFYNLIYTFDASLTNTEVKQFVQTSSIEEIEEYIKEMKK